MFDITLITMGKLKEKFYLEACKEYEKRLSTLCKMEILQLEEEPDRPGALAKEAEKIIENMRIEGAEFITFYMHWGEEYQLSQNAKQKEIAQKLCDMGVDVIIGGHPHVVQPIDLLTSTDGKQLQNGEQYHSRRTEETAGSI